jgi:hypothetical protein
MHGELIELNERLQKMLNIREHQLRRLREELVDLRGPVMLLLFIAHVKISQQTCSKLVNKICSQQACSKLDNLSTNWEQAVRTHVVDKLLKQYCYKSAVGLLQRVRFYVSR